MNGRRGGMIAAGLFLLGASVFAVGPGDFNVGDDLIGTLPVIYPESPLDGLDSGPESIDGSGSGSPTAPESSFVLVGDEGMLEAVIADAYGVGWVEAEPTGDSGTFVFTFHGDFSLVLDRQAFERGRLGVDLEVGLNNLGGTGTVSWMGGLVSAFPLDVPELALPVQDMLHSGALDQSPVSLVLYGADGGTTYLDVSTFGGQVFVHQLIY